MVARRTVSDWQFRMIRKFPRVGFVAPVELLARGRKFAATSANLSLGGILLQTNSTFLPGTELQVRVPLPSGVRVIAGARVVHCRQGVRMGLEFLRMHRADSVALRDSIHVGFAGTRRSIRIPERLFMRLHWREDDEILVQPAETVLLSRHGCLLLTKRAPQPHQYLILWWPERRMGATASVVSRKKAPDGLLEVALEFVRDANFWNLDFTTIQKRLTN